MANLPQGSGPEGFRRDAPRANTYLAPVLVGRHAQTPVTVRNLSATGALIQSRTDLAEEVDVTLARGSLRATGSLVWREGRLGGIKFANPINLAVWVPGATYQGQLDVDRAVAESRGIEVLKPTVVEQASSPEETEHLSERIAQELSFVARKLDALGNELSDDPTIVARHAMRLQDLDIATQVLGHLARLINSAEPTALLKTIGMDDLRRRLERTNVS